MTDTQSQGRAALDAALLTAHRRGDLPALVTLYVQAAEVAFAQADRDAGCFYLTHARVFALESGDGREPAILARLRDLGRDR